MIVSAQITITGSKAAVRTAITDITNAETIIDRVCE